MKVMLHLREGITPARFLIDLSKSIRAGEHKAWIVIRSRPTLQIRHAGRFKSPITLKAAPKRSRAAADHRPPDVIATVTGKDAGFVLRYLAGLIVMKLGEQVEGFYVPVDPP
jgi:hypothetical protein